MDCRHWWHDWLWPLDTPLAAGVCCLARALAFFVCLVSGKRLSFAAFSFVTLPPEAALFVRLGESLLGLAILVYLRISRLSYCACALIWALHMLERCSLTKIADKIVHWEGLAPFLSLSAADIEAIKVKHPTGNFMRKVSLLQMEGQICRRSNFWTPDCKDKFENLSVKRKESG